ncbi:questin oxidase family protein [Vogesella sp. DC21W]|uniref:Questin oxidase family protein n=1 Tax=Vogesella aquatica TaxID=2984206 RepID=A0ABT5J2Q2_9NEIS|nr:questin oxidase family protein [Vogesella aquatica]MDC7719124.1 questin oxidase family protein [Vogesella aquatica]
MTPSTPSLLPGLLSSLYPYAGSHHQGLSNHLPMVLHARAALGAGADALQACLQAGLPRLAALHDDMRPIGHWQEGVGDASAEAALRRYLAAQPDSWPQAMHAVLAQPLGGSFHGVIRLAYALRAGVHDETVAALAYGLACARPAPALTGPAAACATLDALYQRLAGWQPLASRYGLIAEDIVDVQQQLHASGHLPAHWPPEPAAQARWRAARLYLATRDFDVLHLVTGWQAALSVARALGLAEVPAATARQLQAATLALWLRCGQPALPPPCEPAALMPLQPLPGDHDCKLLFSALQLAALDDDPRWLGMAQQLVT